MGLGSRCAQPPFLQGVGCLPAAASACRAKLLLPVLCLSQKPVRAWAPCCLLALGGQSRPYRRGSHLRWGWALCCNPLQPLGWMEVYFQLLCGAAGSLPHHVRPLGWSGQVSRTGVCVWGRFRRSSQRVAPCEALVVVTTMLGQEPLARRKLVKCGWLLWRECSAPAALSGLRSAARAGQNHPQLQPGTGRSSPAPTNPRYGSPGSLLWACPGFRGGGRQGVCPRVTAGYKAACDTRFSNGTTRRKPSWP